MVEIKESLQRFKREHPVPDKVAFIMMKFGTTPAHKSIVETIRTALQPHGIMGVRADERQYHDDLFYNIMTYIYGSGFGVAVFERIDAEEFNPNVAFEIGYMTALRKPVCLLKDKTLKAIQTDLIGRIHHPFDPQDALGTIRSRITSWLQDKGIIRLPRSEMLALQEFLGDSWWIRLSRLSGMSLDNLFLALTQELNSNAFLARCFPNDGRRKAFTTSFKSTPEEANFFNKVNKLRGLMNLEAYGPSN